MEYGLIGEHLPHSFSKIIHEKLAPYSYELHELRPDEVDSFMRGKEFKGINVTIPYKQTVIPYLDEISDQARSIGAVNTVVNRNGRLCGYNTDYFGMKSLIERLGIDPAGKKVLILGTGGTSKTAFAVATDMGASEVYKVSRTGKEGVPTYEEAYERHTDAQIIINTTPCGMYPAIDDCPLDLSRFPDLCGVIDAIYNPLRTVLILEAQKRGIPAEGGLYMLVVQAVYAAELFADRKIESEKTDQVFKEILNSKRNIVLSGMSLAGKTTLGTLLAKKLDRVLEDTDQMIIRKEQRPITEIFATDGEKYFRDLETEMARTLKKNGCIIFLDRPFNQILPADDRPLANTKEKVAALLEKRYPIYKATCDESITNDLTPEEGIAKILAALQNV